MKAPYLALTVLFLISCSSKPVAPKDPIFLYDPNSRLYVESLKEEDSPLLKTYRHENHGEIPFVAINEFCDAFDKTDIHEKKKYQIADGLFTVEGVNGSTFVFDAKKDTVVTSENIPYFFEKGSVNNNGIPFDIYQPRDFSKFIHGSEKTSYVYKGKSRTYQCAEYGFDIVYQDETYYAPFTLLSYLFFGYRNTTYIYNGKHFFDCDFILGNSPTGPYCYSGNGNFLLDRSGGKLGAVLFQRVEPKEEGEAYRFVNTIESSGQTTVISCKNDGMGTLKSYDKDGNYIDEGVYTKVKYAVNADQSEIEMQYYSVLEWEDDQPISEIFTLRVNLEETLFGKKTRSKEVADFTYQEIRFAFYELYGKTQNDAVKDFDSFIENKEYKKDLLSLDVTVYDQAMAKLLLQGVDDGHTTIEYPSIYTDPTFANSNSYMVKYEGPRRAKASGTVVSNSSRRKEAGLSDGLDIKGNTAFIAFSKFAVENDLKPFKDYKGTDPGDYADNPMPMFASSFHKILETPNVKNVVIDLTSNSGGKTASLSYLLSYLTKDPTLYANLELNDSIAEYHYEVDIDQDGVYGGESDSFQGKYDFFVLTSCGSFSCANVFATACKNNGVAKIIGERSAGGSCVVSYLCNSTGYLYHSSSEYISLEKTNDGYRHSDFGAIPDIEVDASHFYDHEYLDRLLSK